MSEVEDIKDAKESKTVKQRLSLARIKAELDGSIFDLEERVQHLEQAANVTPRKRLNLPTAEDFKFFLANHLYWLMMAIILLYGAYCIINSDIVQKWFDRPPVIDKDGNSAAGLYGSITDVSKRYSSSLTGHPSGLISRLESLSVMIDTSANPMSELRSVIQFEEAKWRDAVGEKFRMEYSAGATPSALVKGIIDGLR